MKLYAVVYLLLGGLLVTGCGSQQSGKAVSYQPVLTDDIPHTDKPFLNDAAHFQFVVIGDRTGGHRPEVFGKAMQQINLLQPEFVVSVGDLIEGYTESPEQLDKEWQELEDIVDQLDMPFFYTVGNHDIGNALMRDVWRQRLGRDYWSFVYQDVLFISLNTEDPPIELSAEAVAGQAQLTAMMEADPEGTQQRLLERARQQEPEVLPGRVEISQRQLDFVATILEQNPNVRWTILLMHKPAWQPQYNSAAFLQVEEMLAERPYTVIAGHEHYYMYSRRRGRDYVDMGTTGGIWLRDGPGRMDHVAWVTMTDEGPRFAQIRLEGIFDIRGPQ